MYCIAIHSIPLDDIMTLCSSKFYHIPLYHIPQHHILLSVGGDDPRAEAGVEGGTAQRTVQSCKTNARKSGTCTPMCSRPSSCSSPSTVRRHAFSSSFAHITLDLISPSIPIHSPLFFIPFLCFYQHTGAFAGGLRAAYGCGSLLVTLAADGLVSESNH